MPQPPRISAPLTHAERRALAVAARACRRSQGQQVAHYVREALARDGWLAPIQPSQVDEDPAHRKAA